MSRYDGNAAYDFDLFLPAEKRENKPKKADVVRLPVDPARVERRKAQARRRSRVRSLSSKISAAVAVLFMAGLAVGNIYTRVITAEIRREYNKAVKELEVLEREEIRLNMLIENRCAFQNLESEAAALGMQKPDPAQIRYIRLTEKDKVEVLEGGKFNVAFLESENQE